MPKFCAALFLCGTVFFLCQAALAADHQKEISALLLRHRDENVAFRKSLAGLTPEEKQSALEKFREGQYREGKALRDKIHKEDMDALKERLSKNPSLTDDRRKTILENEEKQYKTVSDIRDKQSSRGTRFYF